MLIHEFVLVSKERLPLADIETIDVSMILNDRTIPKNDILSVPDDVVLHFIDTLERVPSIDGCGSPFAEMHGINYYGITLFNENSAAMLQSVFRRWIEQLSLLRTVSEWVALLSLTEESGQELDKNQVLKTLSTMLDLTEHLKSGNYYLIHFGI